eukprot:scaffold56339_cov31-Tisochrysis_lutea.AAC.1
MEECVTGARGHWPLVSYSYSHMGTERYLDPQPIYTPTPHPMVSSALISGQSDIKICFGEKQDNPNKFQVVVASLEHARREAVAVASANRKSNSL